MMYDSARPEDFAALPKEYAKLSSFERLLVLRSIRQDRCQPALQVLIICHVSDNQCSNYSILFLFAFRKKKVITGAFINLIIFLITD